MSPVRNRLLGLLAVFIGISVLNGAGADNHNTISDSDLQFITKPPKKPLHKHSTHITINAESLRTGWVVNKQCHHNLDQVSALQVVFRRGGVRKLRILRASNIKRAWVEGNSVQLEDIGPNAVLCILSENRSFRYQPLNGHYIWRGGPYMKRFFDGYFPMHVALAIDYPAQMLKLVKIEPAVLKSRAVSVSGHIRLDTMFTGKLVVRLTFAADKKPEGLGWQ